MSIFIEKGFFITHICKLLQNHVYIVLDGYGMTAMNMMRKASCSRVYDELDLPLTLGRDFAGVVVSKGFDVGDKLDLGEEVWGVVPLEQQGCHANYIVINSNMVRHLIAQISNIWLLNCSCHVFYWQYVLL